MSRFICYDKNKFHKDKFPPIRDNKSVNTPSRAQKRAKKNCHQKHNRSNFPHLYTFIISIYSRNSFS